MSIYKDEKFIFESITSLLSQGCREFEFLIMDDGSTDRSGSIVCGFDDPRITMIRQENRGLTVSLNRLLDRAKGEWIARADADDVYLPDRLEKQLHFLSQHPEVGVVGTGYRIIDRADRLLERVHVPVSDPEIRRHLLVAPPLAHPVVMFKKSIVDQVGGYNPEFRYAQDYDLWTRMARKTRFANLPEALFHRRVHPAAAGSKHKQDQAAAHLLIRKRFWETLPDETGGEDDWRQELDVAIEAEVDAGQASGRPAAEIREEMKQLRIAVADIAFHQNRPDIGLRNLCEIARLSPGPLWRSIFAAARAAGFIRTWKALRRLGKGKFERAEQESPFFGK